MKFAEHLSAHITPEWRKQYILYDELKGVINDSARICCAAAQAADVDYF